MRPQSCKAKGRRFQQALAADIRRRFQLPECDVVSTSMGAQGADVQLSAAARACFPFAIEAKNTERPALPAAWRQALSHTHASSLLPMVCFKGNRYPPVAVVCERGLEQLGHNETVATHFPRFPLALSEARRGTPSRFEYSLSKSCKILLFCVPWDMIVGPTS